MQAAPSGGLTRAHEHQIRLHLVTILQLHIERLALAEAGESRGRDDDAAAEVGVDAALGESVGYNSVQIGVELVHKLRATMQHRNVLGARVELCDIASNLHTDRAASNDDDVLRCLDGVLIFAQGLYCFRLGLCGLCVLRWQRPRSPELRTRCNGQVIELDRIRALVVAVELQQPPLGLVGSACTESALA